MMNGRDEGGASFLERLRQNETLNKLSRGRPDLLIFGAPAVLVAVIAAAVIAAVVLAGGGGDGDDQVSGRTPTVRATTTAEASPTPGANAGLKTPIAVSPGDELTDADLAARGAGAPARGPFTATRIMIPKIGVDAPFTVKVVPGDGEAGRGQMPNPNGPTDVAYYDFSKWDGLGGLPGAGGNVVVAGHVDYINYGPAVFWDLHSLVVGDRVQIRLGDGSIAEYAIEFNKVIDADYRDWTPIVAGTADESITLITCGGEFSAGHYDNRQILWGRRVA